jgi:hypothetical protein
MHFPGIKALDPFAKAPEPEYKRLLRELGEVVDDKVRKCDELAGIRADILVNHHRGTIHLDINDGMTTRAMVMALLKAYYATMHADNDSTNNED